MWTVMIAAGGGIAVWAALYFTGLCGAGWSVFFGVASFAVGQAVAGVMIQKRVKAVMAGVQGVLLKGQKQLQAKVQRWQINPPGGLQAAQAEIARDTRVFVKQALAETEKLHRFDRWVPMMRRQIATAKLQLHWMLKDYDEVDALMPQAIVIEPTMAAISMARMYMKDEPIDAIGKVYRKSARRTRYNGNVLPAALWSWILLRRGDSDGAFKALTEALAKSDNPVLKANHEHLMNNRVTHFSNAGLGDQWYALQLEEPKVRTQRQRMQWR